MLLKVGQPSRELSLQTLRQQKKVNEGGGTAQFLLVLFIYFWCAWRCSYKFFSFFSEKVAPSGVKSNETPVTLASHSLPGRRPALRRVALMNELFNWGVFIPSMRLGKCLHLARSSRLTVTVSSSSSESTLVTRRRNSRCVSANILNLHFTPTSVCYYFSSSVRQQKMCQNTEEAFLLLSLTEKERKKTK